MKTLKIRIAMASPLGTPLTGDTLFGHLCWAIRLRHGAERLDNLLRGYTAGNPFAVLSDAFPAGYLPRPSVSDAILGRRTDPARRKQEKQRQWLPAEWAALPLAEWLDTATALPEVARTRPEVITQNTINRFTGTTGSGPFAPRQSLRFATASNAPMEIYAVLDEGHLTEAELETLLADIGLSGYGRDASTGLGKFEVAGVAEHRWPIASALSAFTLAPCAPATGELDASGCQYLPLTRFGRHGNIAALGGTPYKRPILMMQRGALLRFATTGIRTFHGSGLGGGATPISAAIPQTVHQGYAPLVPLAATPEGSLP